jgi:hypothetical protein
MHAATGRFIVGSVLLSLPFLACSGAGPSSSVQRADSAGVEIVTHVGEDVPLDWSFTAAFTIGGEDTEESFYSVDPTTVGIDDRGYVYVLDRDAYRVLVYDDQGRYVRTMGGEGGGPGEMRFPFAILVSPDGTVGVFDISKRGFVRFGPDGGLLDEERFLATYGGGLIRQVGPSLVVSADELDTERGIHTDELIAITGPDTTAVVHIERPAGGVIELASCGMRIMGIGPIFRAGIRWTPLGGTVAAATAADYTITIYRDGVPVRMVRRSLDPVPATPELAAARVGTGMKVQSTAGVRTCDAREVVEQRGIADVIPVIDDVAEGPNGTLWVRRTSGPGSPRPIDVFDADGAYLGTLPDGSPFPVAAFGHRLIDIEADDMDVERLVVYDVARGTS